MMVKDQPTRRWLISIIALITITVTIAVVYVGYVIYQNRNTTPYERDSHQHDGWLYAEASQLTNMHLCEEDSDWAEMGIENSVEFLEGCRAWVKSETSKIDN